MEAVKHAPMRLTTGRPRAAAAAAPALRKHLSCAGIAAIEAVKHAPIGCQLVGPELLLLLADFVEDAFISIQKQI